MRARVAEERLTQPVSNPQPPPVPRVSAQPPRVLSRVSPVASPALVARFFAATEDSPLDSVKALLDQDPSLALSKRGDGQTPLHRAASMGRKGVAEQLLANGADVNAKDKQGNTPLHLAASGGEKDVAEQLLANGADVNAKDKDGDTPLYRAEGYRRKDVAELLRLHGGRDFRGEILDAVQGGNLEVVKTLLIDDPSLVSLSSRVTGRTLLHEAVSSDRKDVAEVLLAHGADVRAKDDHGWTPLLLAAHEGKKDLVEQLLAHGADVNSRDKQGKTPLHWAKPNIKEWLRQHGGHDFQRDVLDAARAGNLELIKTLLIDDPNLVSVSSSDLWRKPLHEAVSSGHKDVTEFLLANGANVNAEDEQGNTPLHLAASEGRKDVAEQLLANGADVNAKGKQGNTPLHLAASGGKKDVAEQLLANGADVNAKDKQGNTPLSWVKSSRHKDIAELLRQHGGHDFREILDAAREGDLELMKALLNQDPSLALCKTNDGLTPLHWAASSGHNGAAELLLANGANVNAEDSRGDTPLHLAASAGCTNVAALLLANHADVNAMNDNGKAPLWYVTVGGAVEDLADLLRRHGATRAEGPRFIDAKAARLLDIWRAGPIDFFWKGPREQRSCEECGARSPLTLVDDGLLCKSCGRMTRFSDYVVKDDDHYKHKEVIEIGEQLYKKGGITLMEAVLQRFTALGGRLNDLSRCWNHVGGWFN